MTGIFYQTKSITVIHHFLLIYKIAISNLAGSMFVHLSKSTNCDTNGTSSMNFVSKYLTTADHCHQLFIYYIISALFIYMKNYINKPWPQAYITQLSILIILL